MHIHQPQIVENRRLRKRKRTCPELIGDIEGHSLQDLAAWSTPYDKPIEYLSSDRILVLITMINGHYRFEDYYQLIKCRA